MLCVYVCACLPLRIINFRARDLALADDDTSFRVRVQDTDDIYVNQTDFSNAYPIVDIDTLTPFGEYIGQSNNTYTNWVAGPQDSKWFNVSGVQTCQQDANCNQVSRQMHRLRSRQMRVFYKYLFAAKRAAALADVDALDARIAAL